MAAMAMDHDHDHASSPAPPARLPAPPYHHSPSAAAAAAVEEVATPPRKSSAAGAAAQRSSPMPSPLQLSGCSLQELLLMSPPPGSARRNRSRHRGAGLDESLEMVAAPAAGTPPRRRRRVAAEQCAAPAVASPRNGRRARRRLEKEIEVEDDAARRARRRKSTRAAATKAAPAAADKVATAAAADKEDTSMALVLASTDAIRGADALEQSGWEDLWERIVDLVMWKNVAKSALWFGLGSMFFFSCSFSREITFSPISALCHMGVMVLGLAFFKDSIPQRQQVERGRSFRLTEDDVLRAARAVLPVANSMISTAQVIFSGEPSMTLKVLPALLFGAKYGSLVTVWRILATAFFASFTLPKLYSCYSSQIHKRVENLTDRALEAWKSCPRKKLVAGTAVTMCWNLFSVKTRIIAAFISVVILRYNQKYRKAVVDTGVESCQDEQEQKMEIED
ncbi:reticulon-like protein B17 isoform X2 [Oryza glaberrima]|uniref:reticulon-like protein B17 isoform X2 n=1 Tax=Oryza glaberrima TaxID=4538 RepID=UPI00224C32F7|nr:reticulon-like protein B17 isoform X2 [Oryza glaberrima]